MLQLHDATIPGFSMAADLPDVLLSKAAATVASGSSAPRLGQRRVTVSDRALA